MLATHPETFEIMNKNNVDLFHGTKVSTLPSIMKYGLNSFDSLNQRDVTVSTGEKFSRGRGRPFISLTNDLDTAIDYSSLDASNQEIQPFGVVIGMSSEDIKHLKNRSINTACIELAVLDDIPIEYIKTISVPESKVQFVRKLINNDRIIVTPMDLDVDKRFYGWNEEELHFSEEIFNEIMEGKKQYEQVFEKKDIREIAEERNKTGILSVYEKIKNMIKDKGINKDNGKDSRS